MTNVKLCFGAFALGILLTGCSKSDKNALNIEFTEIEAVEERESNFFETAHDFALSEAQVSQLISILKKAKIAGETNVGFTITSNKIVSQEELEVAKENICKIMYDQGFMKSRIVDLGLVIYDTAKHGIRIDILKYKVKPINVSPWDTAIGDADVYKNMPRYGASNAYNLNETIVNQADLIRPREYSGQSVADATAALGSDSSSSSSSSQQ